MRIVDAYDGVGNGLVIFNDSFYHIKQYGDLEYKSLYKGIDEKIHGNVSHFFCANSKIFFNESSVDSCYLYTDGRTELLSNKFRVSRKVGNVFETCILIPPYPNSIYDQAFKFITNIGTGYLLYSDMHIYIVANGNRIITCHSYLNNEVSWEYNLVNLGNYLVPVGGGEPLKDEPVEIRPVIGYFDDVLVISTNSEWLIGIEMKTGHLLWTLKGIKEVYPYQQFYKWDKFYSTAPIKVDQERGVIYCFDHNVYWEWDIQTQKLIKLVHKFEEAQQGFYDHSGHRYEIVGDTIYYAYGGSISKFNGREAWPKLIGVSKDTGEIVEQLEFKKKKGEKPIYGWNDFQYADGKFYLLDNNGVLRVIEK